MKRKSSVVVFILIIIALFLGILLLTLVGQKDNKDEPITLFDQNKKEVTFPLEKPTLFFFLTTYT